MTNDERLQAWERLTPRQRSAVVAVVVFGMTPITSDKGGLYYVRKPHAPPAEQGWFRFLRPGEYCNPAESVAMLPTYAADWHGMGLVVERMQAQGWRLDILSKREYDDRWEMVFEDKDRKSIYATVSGHPASAVAFTACQINGNAFDAALREIGGRNGL